MFDKVEVRFALRCVLFGLSGFLVSLQASGLGSAITWNEVINAFLSGSITGLSYAGIGIVSKTVEPSIGRQR